MSLAEKYITFIASGGRTGTTFFGEVLSQVIHDSFSVHEPDMYDGLNLRTFRAVKEFGFYHMIIGRWLGSTGIRNLTQKFLSGSISKAQLASYIRQHREAYYSNIDATCIIESYSHWYGIIPGLPLVFPNYKVIGIVRDPRTWVQSWLNHEGLYGNNDQVLKYYSERLTPAMIHDYTYADKWSTMSPFEKVCWNWLTVAHTLKIYEAQDSNVRVFRFEDLFHRNNGLKYIETMLRFITVYPDKIFHYEIDKVPISSVKNSSIEKNLGQWRQWSPDLCQQLHGICGHCMREFGYGTEEEWQRKIGEA